MASLTSSSKSAHEPAQQSLRSHLYHLLPLPRHALFHVSLQIHQLYNVPLISGEFGVKWKFQNVHSVRGSGLLGRLKTHHGRNACLGNGKGKEKQRDGEDGDDDESAAEEDATSFLDARDATFSQSGSSGRSLGSDAQSSASSSALPSPPSPLSYESSTPSELKAIARGRTGFVKLQRHNVKWEHSVDVAVQMSVQRETLDLLPSELKLVVMQRVIAGDSDAPDKPRLGAVYLNLAEYVDAGPVNRRYLLRESKTNATLQLTIELHHIGGEKYYNAPPLQKNDVMAGVAGLLRRDSNEHLLRPPWWSASHMRPPHAHMAASEFTGLLPREVSLRTTDNIIEAIFNPAPTSSATPSPFTYYVPPGQMLRVDAEHTDAGGLGGDGRSDAGSRAPSISAHSDQSHSSAASQDTPADSEHHRWWWRKLGAPSATLSISRPASSRRPSERESEKHSLAGSRSTSGADLSSQGSRYS